MEQVCFEVVFFFLMILSGIEGTLDTFYDIDVLVQLEVTLLIHVL